MIVVDTSAIIAIANEEAEGQVFDRMIARQRALIGTPTLFEARMVLGTLMPGFADPFLDGLIARSTVQPIDFTMEMYRTASAAFIRFGKGRGHPAKLNFGDCLSYAVAKARGLPLLFKGDDFGRTDVVPAYAPAS